VDYLKKALSALEFQDILSACKKQIGKKDRK